MAKTKLSFNRKIKIAFLIYVTICTIILLRFGINVNGEADKYIEEANRMLKHQGLRNGVFSMPYLIYPSILSFFIHFSISFFYVGILQIVLSAVAAVCLYKLLTLTLNSKSTAFIFFIGYLICFPIQKWIFFLYTESIHISFFVIGIYFFMQFLQNKKASHLALSILLLLLILFSRPVGIIFIVVLIPVLAVWFYKNHNNKISYCLVVVWIAGIIAGFNSPAVTYINPDSLRRMEIICQVAEGNKNTGYVEYNKEGLGKALSVIKNEIGIANFLKAGFKKVTLFFGLYRSYYSWRTNLLLMLCYLLYPFALIGVFSKQTQSFYYLKIFSILYISITTLLIFFTCDEWSNRFVAPVFPFMLILAAHGFLIVQKKYTVRKLT